MKTIKHLKAPRIRGAFVSLVPIKESQEHPLLHLQADRHELN